MAFRSFFRTAHLRVYAVAAFACVVTSIALQGQTARWEPDRGSLGAGQASEIQLVFEGCSPDGTPTVPRVAGLTLELAGTSQNTQVMNGTITRKVILNFVVRPTQRGTARIPAFDVATDKGNVRVSPAQFEVGDATVGQSGASLESIVQSRINVPTTSVWAGEVFPFNYTLSIARRFSPQLASGIEWASAPLTVEEWGKLETTESMVAGELRLHATYRSRGMIRTPGNITLKSAQQLVNLQTGTAMFGVFARPTMEQYNISTAPASVSVKPLPSPAPAEFNGAVGEFVLTSKVVPTSAAVGEPITWTLELSGTGNWPDIAGLPAREASRDFRVVQPQPKRTPKDNSLFDSTFSEDVVLIPTRPGAYTLGPFKWSYFEPKTGQYRTLVTERTTITITAPSPAVVAPGTATAGSGSNASPGVNGTTPGKPSEARPATLPDLIPGEPIAGTASVRSPLDTGTTAIAAAASLVAFGFVWFGLTLQRARRTDPLRLEREARTRLMLTLKAIGPSTEVKNVRSLLRAWQRDTLILLRIPYATPSLAFFEKHTKMRASGTASAWLELWTEADRALYAGGATLPATWKTRALSAAETQTVPGFSLVSLFAPKNLLPFVASLLIVAFVTPIKGEDASVSYQKGDFVAAQQSWSERLTAAPTDWIAHHNLALALGQKDRWGEAAAHASAAFVQQPQNPKVRWTWALALKHAGYTPLVLGNFLTPSPLHRAARSFSASEWKWTLVIAAWLVVGGAALILSRAYGLGPRWLRPAGFSLGACAVLASVLAFSSLHLYGQASDQRSVMIWKTGLLRSIPTEADNSQKTTPLSAGSVAVVDRTFLKWRRLVFPNGQTGWVQSGDVIPLWDLK